jgi:hypothetical protein
MSNFAWIITIVGIGIVAGFWWSGHQHMKRLRGIASPIMDDGGIPPIPIDPNDPPRTVTYMPKAGRPAKQCDCHHRDLVIGDEYLWWPQPDGAVLLICKDFPE